MDDNEKSIIKELEEIQKSLNNIIIPSMGMLDNDIKIDINNEEYINKKDKEEWL